MSNIKITLIRSLIGRNKKHILTAHSLGLKKINDVIIQPNNSQTNGKIFQIKYLIKIEVEKEDI